jgi:hypothetical protein
MLLQIFFRDDESLGDVVDEIRKHCTISDSNLPSAPIYRFKEPDGTWYFSLQVSLSIDQLRAALKNSGMNLNLVGAMSEPFHSFLVFNEKEKQFEMYTVFVLEFRSGKLTVMANRVQTWGSCEK